MSTTLDSQPVRAAVLGVGAIGKHHARIYSHLDNVQLVAVADIDEARRAAIARSYKVHAYASYQELLDKEHVDVISVALPTACHCEATLCALEHGIHVLVEKPIAATVEEADKMIRCAQVRGMTLMVGHVERFNPALLALKARLEAGELGQVFQIHGRRLSPFPAYIRDVGVAMDLATHELDIMRYLVGAEVEKVYAETERNVHQKYEDMLSGILRFENGVVGVLDINWLTPTKVRELRVTGSRGMFLVDYLKQDLYFYENSQAPSPWDVMALFRGVGEGNVMKFTLTKVEPLEAEIRAFIHAATSGIPPTVTGADALHALVLVQLLLASAEQGQALRVREEVAARGWSGLLGM